MSANLERIARPPWEIREIRAGGYGEASPEVTVQMHSSVEQALAQGLGHGLGLRLHLHLAVDLLQVERDGAARDVQLVGRRLVVVTLRHELEQLHLARREPVLWRVGGTHAPEQRK